MSKVINHKKEMILLYTLLKKSYREKNNQRPKEESQETMVNMRPKSRILQEKNMIKRKVYNLKLEWVRKQVFWSHNTNILQLKLIGVN